MKQKLKVVFILITIAILGIIGFQAYWTVNVYKINKRRFDANINAAMQRAMEDCKKDYFDSVRRILVRRLSPPETKIKIDTVHDKDTANAVLLVRMSNKHTSMSTPFNTTIPKYNFYRAKINHRATAPEVMTEMSFYEPSLMNYFTTLLGMNDIQDHSAQLVDFIKKHPNAPIDTMLKFNRSLPHSIYELPDNYKNAGTMKLRKYLRAELRKIGINAPFGLLSSTEAIPPFKSNSHYSETSGYAYKYQGFTMFGITGPVFYIRAVFHKPQYAILKNMLFPLVLSILLMLFLIFCFYYIIRTFIAQNKLADLKDDFINNMTHELKTPIATITVAIEGLQKFNVLNDTEKTQRYLETSRNELSRLNDLVTKVLDIAAFESKEIELSKEDINVDDLVNEVTTSEKQKTAKQVNITFINKDNTETVYADKVHFRNVLTNLVDNAIKYGNGEVDITITCYKQDNEVIFSVKDNGPGIPAAHRTLIFEKFHRVPSGNIHAVKGTGLGLSYVKYIVEAHGGDISMNSEINKGSEFIVSIPLSDG